MTEIMIDTAEEHFLIRNIASAFKWASLAQQLDPNFGSVNQYVEAYRINIAALKIHRNGETDWYNVLGIEQHLSQSVSCQAITHKFVKLAKMVDPEVHCSAAAPRAYKQITTAWENLGEPDKRCAYHARVGLPPPTLEKPPEIASQKSCRVGLPPPRLEKQLEVSSQKRCCMDLPPAKLEKPLEKASRIRGRVSLPPPTLEKPLENGSRKRCRVSLPLRKLEKPLECASQKRCRVKSSTYRHVAGRSVTGPHMVN